MNRSAVFAMVGALVMLAAPRAMGAVVAVCHVPPGDPASAHTVIVGPKAADAHLKNHAGDFLGFCACQGDEDCLEGEFCLFDEGACGGFGECQLQPPACPRYYLPVCGCDGVSYENPCFASAAGTSIAAQGLCPN